MTMRDEDAVSADTINQASVWVFRLNAAPDDTTARDELNAWLAADPAHARAWDLARRTWAVTGQVEPAFKTDWQDIARPRQARRSYRRIFGQTSNPSRVRTVRRTAVSAVAAALLVLTLGPGFLLSLRSDYTTATAENRAVQLEDGSRIVVGASSAIAQRFTERERQVELLKGEAWFDVAHNSERPFVVTADDMRITVTGTAFDVAMTENTLSVGLARGSIRVERPGSPAVIRTLSPGQRLDIDRSQGTAGLALLPPATIGTWRQGRLAVQDVALADVVNALDRHYGGMIFVSGNELAKRKVTGVFDLNDPVRATRALVQPYGGRVRQITPWVMILSAPDGPEEK
ncbi:MAG: FecR domain-containing protein [Sphingobium sp.]